MNKGNRNNRNNRGMSEGLNTSRFGKKYSIQWKAETGRPADNSINSRAKKRYQDSNSKESDLTNEGGYVSSKDSGFNRGFKSESTSRSSRRFHQNGKYNDRTNERVQWSKGPNRDENRRDDDRSASRKSMRDNGKVGDRNNWREKSDRGSWSDRDGYRNNRDGYRRISGDNYGNDERLTSNDRIHGSGRSEYRNKAKTYESSHRRKDLSAEFSNDRGNRRFDDATHGKFRFADKGTYNRDASRQIGEGKRNNHTRGNNYSKDRNYNYDKYEKNHFIYGKHPCIAALNNPKRRIIDCYFSPSFLEENKDALSQIALHRLSKFDNNSLIHMDSKSGQFHIIESETQYENSKKDEAIFINKYAGNLRHRIVDSYGDNRDSDNKADVDCHRDIRNARRNDSGSDINMNRKGSKAYDFNIQGIALFVEKLDQPKLSDLVTQMLNDSLDGDVSQSQFEKKDILIVAIDNISDPQNIGGIIRSALAFGASAVIHQKHGAPNETIGIIKASVGCFERLPYIEVPNLRNALKSLIEYNFDVIGLDISGERELSDIVTRSDDLMNRNLCIVLGSEADGVRRGILEFCTHIIKIGMQNGVESLNVTSSASIILYLLHEFINKKKKEDEKIDDEINNEVNKWCNAQIPALDELADS